MSELPFEMLVKEPCGMYAHISADNECIFVVCVWGCAGQPSKMETIWISPDTVETEILSNLEGLPRRGARKKPTGPLSLRNSRFPWAMCVPKTLPLTELNVTL